MMKPPNELMGTPHKLQTEVADVISVTHNVRLHITNNAGREYERTKEN